MTRPARPPRELSLLDLLAVLWRRRFLIMGVLLVGCGLTTGVLGLLPRVYVARTLVLIDPERGRAGDPPGLGVTSLDSAMIDSQVQILGSRSLAREVVVDLDLVEDEELRAPPPSAGRFVTALWSQLLGPARAGPESDPVDAGADPVGVVVDHFVARLTVAREGRTYAIGVAFRSSDPEKAARIANAVAEHYLLAQLAGKAEAAQRAGGWLAERLAAAKAQHEADLAALRAFREGNLAARGDRGGREDDGLVQLGRELVNASVERSAKEARIARLKDLIRRGDFTAASEDLGSSILLQNLNALKAQSLRREAELKAQYGDRHPKIVDVRRETAELDARIESERAALLQVARTREQALGRELDRAKARAAELDRAGLELKGLEQQAEISRRLYESYLGQVERAAQGEAGQRPDARVISEAVPPGAPVFPRPRLVLSVALTVSLVVALVAVYLAELADRGLRTAADLEEELGLAPLALLPQLPRRGAGPPEGHVLERPSGRFTEGVRGVLASLLAERAAGRGRVILLTSCLPGEGKTTLAMCLGRLAATEGLRSLLIDADLRRPRVHQLLGPEPRPGLAEVLRGECAIEAALGVDARSGLHVLPGSARLAQPTRLLGPDGIGRLLGAAREQFDLILIDTAPLLAVADARLIALLVDRVVLVLRWQTTARSLAAVALAGAPELQGKILGAVLNRVDLRKEARYGRSGGRAARLALAAYYAE